MAFGAVTLLLFLSPPIHAISCSSRYYCVTPEVKYISMSKLPNTFLNATPINEYLVTNVSNCQQFCAKESRCQSINLNVSKTNEYNCSLLDANKYSNSSLLVSSQHFLHLYMPSKCENKPCKNGAVCVPSYNNDSYSCECKSTGIRITRGKHCEILLAGYMSAFVHYSFDNKTKNVPSTSSEISMSSYTISWNAVHEPGCKSPVLLCRGTGTFCMQISNGLPCLNVFYKCMTTKLTYSFWIKYQKKQIGRRANIIRRYSPSSRAGISLLSTSAGYDFTCSLSGNKRWEILDFGNTVNQTRWNQFTFTVDDSLRACAYINGAREKCHDKSLYGVFSTGYNTAVRIGGDWYAGAEPAIYFDDFAIWRVILTEEEILELYTTSNA